MLYSIILAALLRPHSAPAPCRAVPCRSAPLRSAPPRPAPRCSCPSCSAGLSSLVPGFVSVRTRSLALLSCERCIVP